MCIDFRIRDNIKVEKRSLISKVFNLKYEGVILKYESNISYTNTGILYSTKTHHRQIYVGKRQTKKVGCHTNSKKVFTWCQIKISKRITTNKSNEK